MMRAGRSSPPPPLRVLELRSTAGQGGGPETGILLTAVHARPQRVEETLCFLRRRGDVELWAHRRAGELGVASFLIEERGAFDLRTLPRLRRLVRERRIHIVHGHDYKADFYASLLGRTEAVIPVASAHGWPQRTHRERLVYYPAEKRLLARFPLVVADSEPLRQELLAHGARPEAVETLPNAVDTEVLRRDAQVRERMRREWRAAGRASVVGTVGRLDAEKRPDLLLAAFSELRGRGLDALLVVAGSGGLASDVEEDARRQGLSRHCRFLGHRLDAADVHQGFDVFVQASDTEGSPHALLEAMALEIPVVATRVGGVPDIVESGVHGLLVPPGDPGALARAIEETLADPEAARRRAREARSRVEAHHSFARRQRRIEDLYERLAARYEP